MKVEELNEQCESNDKSDFERELIHDYYYEVQDYTAKDEQMILNSDDYFFNVTYNPSMLQALKNVIKNIQNCLDQDDRLNPVELNKVINKVLTMHANRLLKSR